MTRLEQRRQRILREIRKGIAETEEVSESAKQTLVEARATRRALDRAAAELSRIKASAPVTAIDESRRIAGQAAIDKVSEMLRGIGRTTQAEITKVTELNSGSVTHALRVLESEGDVRRTGQRFRGSEEWAFIGTATTAQGRAAA